MIRQNGWRTRDPAQTNLALRRVSDLVARYYTTYQGLSIDQSVPHFWTEPQPSQTKSKVTGIDFHNAGGAGARAMGEEADDGALASFYYALHSGLVKGREKHRFERGMAYNGMIGKNRIFEGRFSPGRVNGLPTSMTHEGEFITPNALVGRNDSRIALAFLSGFDKGIHLSKQTPMSEQQIAMTALEVARYALLFGFDPKAPGAISEKPHVHGAKADGQVCPSPVVQKAIPFIRSQASAIVKNAARMNEPKWQRFVDGLNLPPALPPWWLAKDPEATQNLAAAISGPSQQVSIETPSVSIA